MCIQVPSAEGKMRRVFVAEGCDSQRQGYMQRAMSANK